MNTHIDGQGRFKMNAAVGYIMISVIGGAVGQILLKKGMGSMGPLTLSLGKLGEVLWRIGTNPYVIAGLAIYVTGTVFWLVALSRVDLSYAYPFASLSYVVMLAAAWLSVQGRPLLDASCRHRRRLPRRAVDLPQLISRMAPQAEETAQ